MRLLIDIVLSTVAVFIAGFILPGVRIKGFGTALIVAVMLGIIMPAIGPLLVFMTLPVNIMTLGFVTFVVNGLLIVIVAALIPGFSVDSFGWALGFSIVLSAFPVFIGLF